MKNPVGMLLAVGCISLSASTLFAGDTITVRAEINKGFITIGERVLYTVFIRHAPKIRVLSPVEFPNTRDFEVKSSRNITPKKENELVIEGCQFEITAYGLGEFVIDEISIRYLSEDGAQHEIRTNRIYVTVESVDKSGKPKMDIRGIKGPVNLPSTLIVWMALVTAILLLTLSGFLLWKKFAHAKEMQASQETILSPHDEAYQALRRLFDSPLIREGRVKEYYYRLSEIIKCYLERRFQFSAIEKTTSEITKDIEDVGIDDLMKHSITQWLTDADIVKFAKYLPEPQEIILMNKRGMEIVDKTKPVDTPVVVMPIRST